MNLLKSCIVCGQAQHKLFSYQSHDYFRCVACGLVSTYPYPSEAEILEHYTKGFDEGNYYRLRQWGAQYMKIYAGMADFLKQSMAVHGLNLASAKVLDIGCFTGDFIEVLDNEGAKAYGIELQSRAVEIANQRFPGRVYQTDVFDSTLPKSQFDVISMLGLIEHVTEPVNLLRRVTDILTPGGILLIQTPNSGSLLASLLRQFWPPYAPIEHIHLFSRRSLETALSQLGIGQLNFKPHWKWLPVGYVYNNLQIFGPEFFRLATPFFRVFGRIINNWRLPFYGGEMLVVGRKQAD
jgi:2-polyprenyl-3-methyl-5-hydroxy-6-metoxy-1,4-benzoquinol methylase